MKSCRGLKGLKGLEILIVNGEEFKVYGPVTYSKKFDTYYCAGESWPSEIVKGVIKAA